MQPNPRENPIDVEKRSGRMSRWAYAVALAVVIMVASGRSHVASPNVVDFDKIAHFAIFGLLATLVARTGLARSRMRWAVLLVSLFALTDEWHQSFTPGRAVEVADWIADTLGAITAVALYRQVSWYRNLLEKPLFRRHARVEK